MLKKSCFAIYLTLIVGLLSPSAFAVKDGNLVCESDVHKYCPFTRGERDLVSLVACLAKHAGSDFSEDCRGSRLISILDYYQACAKDMEKYCNNVPFRIGMLDACIAYYDDGTVSKACHDGIQKLHEKTPKERWGYLGACTIDVSKYCAKSKGIDRKAKCLSAHKKELQPRCQDSFILSHVKLYESCGPEFFTSCRDEVVPESPQCLIESDKPKSAKCQLAVNKFKDFGPDSKKAVSPSPPTGSSK